MTEYTYSLGKVNEDKFYNIISKGFNITKSSTEIDINQHIDFYIDNLFKDKLAVDVKNNQAKDINNIGVFVEIMNTIGNKGWIDGEADCIVFRINDNFLFINREELIFFLRNKLEDRIIHNKTRIIYPYKIYRRSGKKDQFIFIPIDDIEHLVKLKISVR